jgi:hypothetical protein
MKADSVLSVSEDSNDSMDRGKGKRSGLNISGLDDPEESKNLQKNVSCSSDDPKFMLSDQIGFQKIQNKLPSGNNALAKENKEASNNQGGQMKKYFDSELKEMMNKAKGIFGDSDDNDATLEAGEGSEEIDENFL